MNDGVKSQQFRFMGYNLVAFTLIFTLFGIILYSQISSSLYRPVEEALRMSRETIEESDQFIERELSVHDLFPREDRPDKAGDGRPYNGPQKNVPMRVQTIVRDGAGGILNQPVLGRLYFEDYLADIPFSAGGDGSKTDVFQLGDSAYLSLTFPKETADGETYYIQLLSNVEGEKNILDSFVRLLVLCVVVFVLLSITASYLLSRITMNPLIRSWKRQREFVADASHELRTPLTIIQNKLESMLTRPQSTIMERADEIGVSLSETRRLSKLTADLMTLARADSSEIQLEKELFPLDELIARVSEPYRELAELQEKHLTMDLRYGGDLNADKSRIHQLMVILLDNALKYTLEGDGIVIRTDRRDGRAIIEVADTGIGIPEESRERIFDRFYRADKARTRTDGGSGLGLSIAKWIVDEHEGSITAKPGENGGTVFRVKLKE